MSKILDIGGIVTYEEKGVWAYLVAVMLTYGIYVALILQRANGGQLRSTTSPCCCGWCTRRSSSP